MTISIVIPTRNRADSLARTLGSVAALDRHPADFEVLIVDNGSTDHTPDVVVGARSRWPAITWRCVQEPMPGLLSGRHRGALEAAGGICAFVDDDVCLGRDWLNGMEEAFRGEQVSLVGGPSRAAFRAAVPEWLTSYYREGGEGTSCGPLSLFDAGSTAKEIDPAYVWGLNFSIRKTVLFEVGGFHPDCLPQPLQRYQGDGESGLSDKIAAAGLKAVYHPAVAVEHEVPAERLTIEYFERRAFYQGVCDSFRDIRRHGTTRVANEGPIRAGAGTGLLRQAVRSARRLAHAVSMPGAHRSSIARAHSDLHARTDAAHAAGYAFHQREVQEDAALLQWVMKPDYWDYRLPSGWEARMASA